MQCVIEGIYSETCSISFDNHGLILSTAISMTFMYNFKYLRANQINKSGNAKLQICS